PARAALLPVLIQSPSGYDPITHSTAAPARRETGLRRLVAHHHLRRAEAVAAARQPLPTRTNQPPRPTNYFAAAVTRELLGDHRLGRTVAERKRLVYRGGLRIHTTVDPGLERLAQSVVAGGVPGG